MLQSNLQTPTTSCQLLEAATDKQSCLLVHKHHQMHCTNSLTLQTEGPQSPANWKDVLQNHKHMCMQEMTGWQCPAGPSSSAGKSPYSHSLFSCTILHTNAFLAGESKTSTTHIKDAIEPWSNSKTSKPMYIISVLPAPYHSIKLL